MDNNSNVVNALASTSDFLKYGPIGLAGLMLVLVIITLIIGSIDDRKERLLKQFLYVGAFCFVVSSIIGFLPGSIHTLYLRVDPLESDIAQKLPPPRITIDNDDQSIPLKYKVSHDVTAIVDVTKALSFVDAYAGIVQKQSAAISQVQALVTKVSQDLSDQNNLAIADSCSGGPHGIPTNHSGEITRLNLSLSSDIANVGGIISSVVQLKPPTP